MVVLPLSVSVAFLSTLRAKAIRRRVWFKALNRVERGLVDLVLRIKKRVRNQRLADALLAICEKLQWALMGFAERLRALAFPHARRLAELASRWGHPEAYLWPYDLDYLEWLGLTLYHGGRAKPA